MTSISSVPSGFPAKLEGPMAWDGASYKNASAKYVHELSQEDLIEVDKALRHFQGLKLASGFLSPETFPLSSKLATQLAKISQELHEGRGFGVLRGLDPRKYGPEENVIVFTGIASYVAPERATDSAGLTLSHIRNATKDRLPTGVTPEQLRPSKRPEAMAFHTDTGAGDILAMYIKGLKSHSGGTQHLASFWQIYNVLAKEAPHVLKTLANPFPWEEVDPVTKRPRAALRPIIFYIGGKVQIQFVTVPLRGSLDHPRPSELPPLTAAQEEALDKLQSVAERLSFELDRVLGDIQFVNNLSILHGRTAYYEEETIQKIWAKMETTAETVVVLKNTIVEPNDNGEALGVTTTTTTTAGPTSAVSTTTGNIATPTSPTFAVPTTTGNTTSETDTLSPNDIFVTTVQGPIITKTTTAPIVSAGGDPVPDPATVLTTIPNPNSNTTTTTEMTTITETETERNVGSEDITTITTTTTTNRTRNTTLTRLPAGDGVTIKYETNSPRNESALSKTTLKDSAVNGDANTTMTVTTKTTTCYTPPESPSKDDSLAAPSCPTQAARHFLRLFLRDRTRAWDKPDVYKERFENCFAVPPAEQFLPEVDYDPTATTVTTGGEAHG